MDALKGDDDDVLIGNPAMAEFSTREGFRISTSTMQKHTSPAISTGPELIGYYGKKPASTKGRVRAWNRSRIRPVGKAARSDQPARVTSAAPAITPVPIITVQPSTPGCDHAIEPNADRTEA